VVRRLGVPSNIGPDGDFDAGQRSRQIGKTAGIEVFHLIQPVFQTKLLLQTVVLDGMIEESHVDHEIFRMNGFVKLGEGILKLDEILRI